MRSDIGSAPHGRKSIAAVQHIIRKNTQRAESVPGERDDIRIVTETAKNAAVLIFNDDIGGVGAGAEKLHASAYILLDVAQAVLLHSCLDRLTSVIADEGNVIFTQKYLRTCYLPQLCGIVVVVNMGMSEEDVADIELPEPFPQPVTAEVKACINEKVAVSAVYDIAGNR